MTAATNGGRRRQASPGTRPHTPIDFIRPDPSSTVLGEDARALRDGPDFSISETSKFFFGREPHWLRWAEGKGFFKKIKLRRTETDMRRYTLRDIEKIAYALHDARIRGQTRIIDETQLKRALLLIRIVADVALGWED